MFDQLLQMSPMEITAQIIGVIATLSCLISFQQKTQRAIVLFQLLNHALWMTHFLLLGAWSGSVMNIVGILRCTVFSLRETHAWARHNLWYFLFGALIIGASVFSWVQGDGAMALLPMAGMLLTTYSLTLHDPFRVRCLTFFNSPFWMVYDLLKGTLFGVLTEIMAMTSIVIGVIRVDLPARRAKMAEHRSGEAE